MKLVRTLILIFAFAVIGLSANAQHKEESSATPLQYDFSRTVSIFPNPAVEYLNIKFEDPIARKTKIAVHNIIGNVLDVESEMIDEHEIRLKVKDLPVGYYLLALRDEDSNSKSTIKFLKR